jgi:hypothetical protein
VHADRADVAVRLASLAERHNPFHVVTTPGASFWSSTSPEGRTSAFSTRDATS